MILVDSSVWIDHVRRADGVLADLLNHARVVCHPFVIGELALGSFRARATIIADLQGLPKAEVANEDEVMAFIDNHGLHGRGIGYIDVHLLASARLTQDATLWTRDRRLHAVAAGLGLAAGLQ